MKKAKRNGVDSYLEDNLLPPLSDLEFNILEWWEKNTAMYPNLSKMARDILAIPVSTVSSESAFSTAGRVVDDHRSRLNPTTIEALVCTQDWFREEYYIGNAKILKVSNDSMSRFNNYEITDFFYVYPDESEVTSSNSSISDEKFIHECLDK